MKKLIVFFVMFVVLLISVSAQVQVVQKGAELVPKYENCAGKRFGLVGASNTVEEYEGKPIPSSLMMTRMIEKMCPGSKVFINARGGAWPGAQVGLVNTVLQNDNLDYVILNPSANGQQEGTLITPEQYKEAAINLARIVKEKNSKIKVIMLTNTPFKGALGEDNKIIGTAAAVQRVKTFNADLLNNWLGRKDLIDYAIDTYSVTEDPLGSDACGNYCPGDHLHFNLAGNGAAARKKIVKAILDRVFGTPRVPATSASSPGVSIAQVAAGCLNSQRCKEIDEVWTRIAKWLLTNRKGEVWDTVRGWIGYDELYNPKAAQPQTTNIPSQVVTGSASSIAEIDNLKTVSPNQVRDFIRVNLGEQYLEDVEYLTRILTIERGCSDTWKQERGAIAQVVINRVLSSTFPNTVKGVVTADQDPDLRSKGLGWFGVPSSKINDANNGIEGGSTTRNCAISAIKFMVCVGDEDIGAKKIGGRIGFIHRQTQVALGRTVQKWNNVNPIQVQGGGNVATFSGSDTSSKDCSLRKYKGGSTTSASTTTTLTGGATYFKNSILEQACTKESLKCVIPSQNSAGKKEAQLSSRCPAGMVQEGTFCIDQFEAMLVDKNNDAAWSPYCKPGSQINNLKAVSISGVVPQTTVSQLEAKQACANSGKRLCASDEWLNACRGSEERKYPYGNEKKNNVCNDESKSPGGSTPQRTVAEFCTPGHEPFYEKQPVINGVKVTWNTAPWMLHPKNNQQENSLDPTGSNSECRTPEFVYDQVGNLDEWVADSNGVFRGGFYHRTESKSTENDGCRYITTVHATNYADYSLGFRCCADLI